MGEGIFAGIKSDYFIASTIAKYFNDLETIYANYKTSTAVLHNYMKQQWNFIAGMADTFREMKLEILICWPAMQQNREIVK
ncbi:MULTISPECIES: hypothetical protein [Hungatella]|uniref:hypothetical protein n=1 Tax=Hungatella TaxID=1649459 RepID=UPI000B1BC2F2|nr:hypothetical protein [Hungatella effluvii]